MTRTGRLYARVKVSEPIPRRGEVWLAQLDKRRPVVVLTRDPMGRFLNRVTCVPITSNIRNTTTEVPIGPEAGISMASVATLDNIRQVDRDRLVRRVGHVRASTMQALCRALAIAIGCEP